MKIYKIVYGMLAAALMTFASCSNDYPTFDDADAFVAMTSSSAFISETGDSLVVPVMLTSLSGIEKTVEFTLTPDSVAGAVEGTHYTLVNESKSLTFTKAQPTQYIKFKIKDNDVFGGDVKFTISLVQPQGVNLGANKTCTVTIEDDEHPLAFILGEFTAKGTSYFDGEIEWTARIEKDASNLNMVWITGLVDGTTTAIYGTVNEDKTEVTIPMEQQVHPHSTYDILLEAYGWDGSARTSLEDGAPLVGKIEADGTISFPDYWFGGYAFNKSDGSGAGWWDLLQNDVVLKKK
ncbi:MAG: hypothetical protein IKN15_08325 [Bacteroidaceae bacterium]|nr:hypothetical protein [Bacteroidaceae bacterium]